MSFLQAFHLVSKMWSLPDLQLVECTDQQAPQREPVPGSPTLGLQSHYYLKTWVLEPELMPSCLCGELFINCAVSPVTFMLIFHVYGIIYCKAHYLSTVR